MCRYYIYIDVRCNMLGQTCAPINRFPWRICVPSMNNHNDQILCGDFALVETYHFGCSLCHTSISINKQSRNSWSTCPFCFIHTHVQSNDLKKNLYNDSNPEPWEKIYVHVHWWLYYNRNITMVI